MYVAQGFEHLASGMGSGAFGVLLLRLTQKQFSATQFALLSSLFTIPRVLAGPPAGVLADWLGWRDFFILTVFTGIPGLVMLARFVPWGVREPALEAEPSAPGRALARTGLAGRAASMTVVSAALGLLTLALLDGLRDLREGRPFDVVASARDLLAPASLAGWLTLLGLGTTAILAGLGAAAARAARQQDRGGGRGGGPQA
jgi:PAT family beta-lactamase induction signal transducer AmpG